MSKFTVAASTSQSLSLAAMEEASRLGQREADLEHLLLALTLSTHPAGQVLRGYGVTLDAVRQAVADQRAAQLQSIGIHTRASEDPARITFQETGGYEWSARCVDILNRASSAKKTGDAGAVLRELLNDRSGIVEDLLERVGTSSTALIARLDEVADLALHDAHVRTNGERSGFIEAFVPAPLEEVWGLLVDPLRMPEWDVLTARVELLAGNTTAEPGASWWTYQPVRRPDGKAVRVRTGFARRRVEVLKAEANAMICWRLSYPDAARSTPSRVALALSPAAGGTHLEITLAWRPRKGWRRIVGFPMRPLQRFAIWMQLTQISSGISRVFR